ncbi:MAG: hypothetical protein CBC42_00465 [Betaproteobacteria bacterium TMED82]|nr:MAG: hypothetical protein CBC42_00465 [Betaproteobacteria bacterium TMED82]|tara:strand:- start:22495 stop:23481 length:987 start_codon:yes stop_codon:yes gene_type:complete
MGKSVLVTKRGKVFLDKIQINDIATCFYVDFPFARGVIFSECDFDWERFIEGFKFSLSKNFIEEDALVLGVMIAAGDRAHLDENQSICSASLLPRFLPASIFEKSWKKKFTKKLIFDSVYSQRLSPNERTFGVYPIVANLIDLVSVMRHGAKAVQLRAKGLDEVEAESIVREAVLISRDFPSTKLFINDYWKLALKYEAYGLHLGQEDLLSANIISILDSGLALGLSTHSFWEMCFALSFRPSYVACGPIFPTRAKEMPWRPQGVKNLSYWTRLIECPVIGIGGINSSNISDIKLIGCAGAAVIDGLVKNSSRVGNFTFLSKCWGDSA